MAFSLLEDLKYFLLEFLLIKKINCYDAFSVGIEALKEIDGVSFNEIKQSKKNKVISLLGVNSKVKIGEKSVAIDPLLPFQRICVM